MPDEKRASRSAKRKHRKSNETSPEKESIIDLEAPSPAASSHNPASVPKPAPISIDETGSDTIGKPKRKKIKIIETEKESQLTFSLPASTSNIQGSDRSYTADVLESSTPPKTSFANVGLSPIKFSLGSHSEERVVFWDDVSHIPTHPSHREFAMTSLETQAASQAEMSHEISQVSAFLSRFDSGIGLGSKSDQKSKPHKKDKKKGMSLSQFVATNKENESIERSETLSSESPISTKSTNEDSHSRSPLVSTHPKPEIIGSLLGKLSATLSTSQIDDDENLDHSQNAESHSQQEEKKNEKDQQDNKEEKEVNKERNQQENQEQKEENNPEKNEQTSDQPITFISSFDDFDSIDFDIVDKLIESRTKGKKLEEVTPAIPVDHSPLNSMPNPSKSLPEASIHHVASPLQQNNSATKPKKSLWGRNFNASQSSSATVSHSNLLVPSFRRSVTAGNDTKSLPNPIDQSTLSRHSSEPLLSASQQSKSHETKSKIAADLISWIAEGGVESEELFDFVLEDSNKKKTAQSVANPLPQALESPQNANNSNNPFFVVKDEKKNIQSETQTQQSSRPDVSNSFTSSQDCFNLSYMDDITKIDGYSEIEEQQETILTNSRYRRFLVLEAASTPENDIKLRVLDEANGFECYLLLKDEWKDCKLECGDQINVVGKCEPKSSSYTFVIDHNKNVLVVLPDVLITGTNLSNAQNCMRSSFLSQTVKTNQFFDPCTGENLNKLYNSDQLSSSSENKTTSSSKTKNQPSSTVAFYGTLIHEVFQISLERQDFRHASLSALILSIICDKIVEIYAIGEDEKRVQQILQNWLPTIIEWAQTFVPHCKYDSKIPSKGIINALDINDVKYGLKFKVEVVRALETEEHVVSLMYGLKGDIDASLIVKMIPLDTSLSSCYLILPLEIKSGRLNVAYSYQVILYSLLMSDRYNRDIPVAMIFGIKDKQTLAISVDRKSVLSVFTLRNRLAKFLKSSRLPPVIRLQNQCNRCFHVDNCMTLHKLIEAGDENTSRMDKSVFDSKTSFLKPAWKSFVSHWFKLIELEAQEILKYRNEVWAMPQSEREKNGRCLAGLRIVSVSRSSASPNHQTITHDQLSQGSQLPFEGSQTLSTGKRQTFLTFERWPIQIENISSTPILSTPQDGIMANQNDFSTLWPTQSESIFTQNNPRKVSFLDSQFSVGDHVLLGEGRHTEISSGTVVEITSSRIVVVINKPILNAPQLERSSDVIPQSQRFTTISSQILHKHYQASEKVDGKTKSPIKTANRCVGVNLDDIEDLCKENSFTPPSDMQKDSSLCPDMKIRPITTIRWRIDRDEVQSGFNTIKGNILQLFHANEWANKKRRLIVDLEAPTFSNNVLDYKELDHKLNEDQISAITKIVNANDYALILGMPGTGKTTTIAHLVKILVERGNTVLITACTHSAVDALLLKIRSLELEFLRIGLPNMIHPLIRPFSLSTKDSGNSFKSVKEVEQLIGQNSKRFSIVAATCSGVNHSLLSSRFFDYCIVDEASQLTMPVCLGPLRFADKFVLVGDLYQLPPIVRSAEAQKSGLSNSLFKRLYEKHPSAVVRLRTQYRMNAEIMSLCNKLVYQNLLVCGSKEVEDQVLAIPFMERIPVPIKLAMKDEAETNDWLRYALKPENKVIFLNTDAVTAAQEQKLEGKDIIRNVGESMIVAMIVATLLTSGIQNDQIGIISPLRSQLKCIHQAFSLLHHINSELPLSTPNKPFGMGNSNRVNLSTSTQQRTETKPFTIDIHTVDKYQGSDKDCIIISMVRSNPNKNVGNLLKDWRRINVAFTRAKKKLIIIGSKSTLSSTHLLSDFFSILPESRICNLSPPALELYQEFLQGD